MYPSAGIVTAKAVPLRTTTRLTILARGAIRRKFPDHPPASIDGLWRHPCFMDMPSDVVTEFTTAMAPAQAWTIALAMR